MNRVIGLQWMPILAMLLGAPLLPAGPSLAQENELRILVPRLERLEADLADMQRRVARGGGGGAAPPGSFAAEPSTNAIIRLDDRLTLMERQLAELTGRIEETGHRVDQLRTRVEKLAADVDFRLGQLEGGKSGGGAAAIGAAGGAGVVAGAASRDRQDDREERPIMLQRPPTQPTQQQAAATAAPRVGPILPDGSPMDRYNFAIGLLARQDYNAAEAAFREFVAAHANDRLAGNAQYWLGETYYVRNDMNKAAQAFLDGVKKYPDGPKAADTMLKLGMSLTAINQKTEACGVFGELRNRYPKLAPDTSQGLVAARERAGCR